MRSRFQTLFSAGVLAIASLGCHKDQIREYTVPKEQDRRLPMAHAPSQSAPMVQSEAPAASQHPEWTVPASWKELPGEGMRYATLVVEAQDPPLQIRVTPLGLNARDLLSNVNRWRGQIGLEPVGVDKPTTGLRTVQVDGRAVDLVDLTGPKTATEPATRILAAILPGDESVWFFFLSGPVERVDKHAAEFERFIHSVHLTTAPVVASMPADHPPIDAAPGSQPSTQPAEMTWTLPAGWHEEASTSAFRIATFKVAGGAGDTEIAITKFAGGAGGVLANINRWRGQIGLPPVGSLNEQAMQHGTVAGLPADRLDLSAPTGGPAERKRMIVVTVAHNETTYFIKMTGSSASVDTNTKAFDAFITSVQFTGAQS